MYGRFEYYGVADIDREMALEEFRLLPRSKGDLRGAKKGETIVYKENTIAGSGGEKKLTVVGITKHKGYGKMVTAKDAKGREYHLPLNSSGQATVVLRKTGDPSDPNDSVGSQDRPVAWISEGLDEACGKKKGKKKSRKEEIEDELLALEATSSPFPDVRARRIEELRAELEEAKGGGPQWKKAAEKLLKKSLQSGEKGQEAFHYRAYLRAVVSGTPSGHLAQKFPDAEQAKQDLIDLAGKM